MKDFTNFTPTELLKRGNDIKARHDVLKAEIIQTSFEIENLEKILNKNLNELDELEKEYVAIIEVIETRNNVR
jgi:uncharacterized coiled-coil DUF342 family protein